MLLEQRRLRSRRQLSGPFVGLPGAISLTAAVEADLALGTVPGERASTAAI